MRSPRSFVVLVALVWVRPPAPAVPMTTLNGRRPAGAARRRPAHSRHLSRSAREPERIGLTGPSFEALPGAKADYGRLGGSVYQVEVPERWNGRLVLWMHGFEEFAREGERVRPTSGPT